MVRTGQRKYLSRMSIRPYVLVGLSLLAACGPTLDATSTQYIGAPQFPPTDPAKVQILRTEPTRPHDRLGEIVVDASVDPQPSVDQIEEKLRTDGAKIGAEAVVIVLDRTGPVAAYVTGPYWGRSIETVSGRRVVGVAIHYR